MAEQLTAFASTQCRYCKTARLYRLADLKRILGDIDCDAITDRNVWRCTKCQKTHTIDFALAYPSAAEQQTMKVRRLDRIDYVRKIIWREE